VMTYQLEGNNPNRQTDYPTPAEVREMLQGAPAEQMPAAPPTREEHMTGEIIHLDSAFYVGVPEYARVRAARGRCPTCGRKFDCCCQGCEICPQRRMEPGKVSAAWARRMTAWGDADPREAI
jgi:hypothetical protein